MTQARPSSRLIALSRRGLILGAAAGLSGCGWLDWLWPNDQLVALKDTAEYRLAGGDKVRVTVHREADLSGDVVVDPSGMVGLPMLGAVKAGGLTTRELEAVVTRRLSEGFLKKPQVTVEILNHRPFYIYGEVRAPGGYAFVQGMKMVNAAVIGGGYTPRARQGRFVVTRVVRGKRVELDAGDADDVIPGDIIRIPERYF